MNLSNAEINPLEIYFKHNKTRLIHKWTHYFNIYHRYFQSFRNKEITVVEFGVSHGGSLQMWKDYFGKKAKIIGVDIDKRCQDFEEEQIKIYIGDQENRQFLKELCKKIGSIDILIDDGGHSMNQQINTFEEIFPALQDGGIYLIEDLHTSYWETYGGGYKRQGTFIEYAKNLIDQIHAWHFPSDENRKNISVGYYTQSIIGMHVYDSIIVFEKGNKQKPFHEQTGMPSF